MFPLPHRLGPYSFCARRVVAAALLLAAAASPVGAQSSRERPYPVRRATSEIVVDGRVLEEAWADALTLELRYEVRPGENVEPPVRTEMFLAYDDTRLLVAFKCHDPDPSQIRARYTDRDNVWNDDFVGVVLDTFNDERRAYELFVNAYGGQMDAVNDDVAGNYDMAWGAIWDSAGRITDAGYEVEMAIPFNQLRFQAQDRRLFTQFLFSYKVNPQTVLYLGYSDNSVGTDRFGLLRADRTFFVKAGYAWLL